MKFIDLSLKSEDLRRNDNDNDVRHSWMNGFVANGALSSLNFNSGLVFHFVEKSFFV